MSILQKMTSDFKTHSEPLFKKLNDNIVLCNCLFVYDKVIYLTFINTFKRVDETRKNHMKCCYWPVSNTYFIRQLDMD